MPPPARGGGWGVVGDSHRYLFFCDFLPEPDAEENEVNKNDHPGDAAQDSNPAHQAPAIAITHHIDIV